MAFGVLGFDFSDNLYEKNEEKPGNKNLYKRNQWFCVDCFFYLFDAYHFYLRFI